MSFPHLLAIAQAVLVLTAGLITLMEDPGQTGASKKAAVVRSLGQIIDALPLSGLSGTVIRTAAKVAAPFAVDLLVAKANQLGHFAHAT